MAINLRKLSDEKKAIYDGTYLRSLHQSQKLSKILSEMECALDYLRSHPEIPNCDESIKAVLKQKATGETLLELSKKANKVLANIIKESDGV